VSAGHWLALGGGIVLLAVLAVDIYAAVLHHWGSSGPVSGRLASGVWRGAVALTAGLAPSRRRRLLGQVGPMLIPLTVVFWAGLIVVAFALIYLPWIAAGFTPDTNVAPPARFTDALHFSGVTLFTIGYGDLVPSATAMRFIGVAQGGAGFAFITLVISYFTGLYGAYSLQRSAASSLHFQTGPSADAARFIAHHAPDGGAGVLAGEVARLREDLAGIRGRYLTYPILHYFVASRPEMSLVRLVFVAQEIGLLLDTAIDRGRAPGIAGLGTRSGLRSAAAAVQDGMLEALVGSGTDAAAPSGGRPYVADDVTRAAWRARFRTACDTLALQGVAVDRFGEEKYCRERAEWESGLRAASEALGESWDEITTGR
jgi:hypothetical protein